MMHNANPNPENESNQTPFHEALEGGHDEIIQILVENKADVNIRDKDGNTALHLAVKRQSGDLGKILMMHNANPNLENESNQTPPNSIACFHEALEGGHDEIIQNSGGEQSRRQY
jgi:ankyrin repeat protein